MQANLNVNLQANPNLDIFRQLATPQNAHSHIAFQGQGPARTIQAVPTASPAARDEIVTEFKAALRAEFGHSITSFIFPDHFRDDLENNHSAVEIGLKGRTITETLDTATQIHNDIQAILAQTQNISALNQEITGHPFPAIAPFNPADPHAMNIFLEQVEGRAYQARQITLNARNDAVATTLPQQLEVFLNHADRAIIALERIRDSVTQIVNLKNRHLLAGASLDSRAESIAHRNAITDYTNGAIANYNFIDARLDPQSNDPTPSPSGSESEQL